MADGEGTYTHFIPDDVDRQIAKRIAAARKDRSRHIGPLNRFYELALPHRQLIQSDAPGEEEYRAIDEQGDVFDNTLQATLQDFVSDMVDAFTPHYKPWAKMRPTKEVEGLSKAEQKQLDGEIERQETELYNDIRRSDFYEQSQEVWADLGGAAAGMVIPMRPRGEYIRCTPILMSSLLIDHGPHGDLDGKWHEFRFRFGDIDEIWPGLNLSKHPRFRSRAKETSMVAIQGAHRVWEKGPETYCFSVSIDGTVVHKKNFEGPGSNPVAAMRWRVSPPSAWGPGPGMVALPPASTLNELAYMVLKYLGKQADTPFWYTADGLFNPSEGINAGESFPAGNDFNMDWLVPEGDMQATLFEQEDLRAMVRQALYQDRPFQRGETPPTATQWLDEKAMVDRRLQLARMRIYREWVMPILRRFWWIRQRQGLAPPIEIGGELIELTFDTPVSRASDMEEVNRSLQVAMALNQAFGEKALLSWDAETIMDKVIEKTGDEILSTKPFAEQDQQGLAALSEMRNLVSSGKP